MKAQERVAGAAGRGLSQGGTKDPGSGGEASHPFAGGVQVQPSRAKSGSRNLISFPDPASGIQDQTLQSPRSGPLKSIPDRVLSRLRRDSKGKAGASPLPYLSWCLSFIHGQQGLCVRLRAWTIVDRGAHSKGKAWQVAGGR